MPNRLHRHTGARRLGVAPRLLAVLALVVAAAAGTAQAQVFSADRYLQECLRFEAGRDYGTARGSCLNALQAQPGMVAAELALGRIEVALGEYGSAEGRINRVRDRVEGAEPLVLLAEIAYRTGRLEEAAALGSSAASRLARDANLELSARVAHLDGLIALRGGRYDDALAAFERAVGLDGLNVTYRLADASLRLRLGDAPGALDRLRQYRAISGDAADADVTSLLGRALWVDGALTSAAEHVEAALAQRSLRDASGQADDLRVLALIYAAQGDLDRGGMAVRESMRRGNLLADLWSNGAVWIAALVGLLLVHLLGESRHGAGQFVVRGDAPTWSVGRAYAVLVAAVLTGLAVALAFSLIRFGNVLALLTPVQQDEARAVYFVAFALTAAGLSWGRLRALGLDAGERLMGSPTSDHVASGFAAGLGLLALVLGYFALTERAGLYGTSFFVDLARPTLPTAVALALLPVSELYFRSFLYPALVRRYDPGLAVIATGLVYGLAFGTPVLLMVAVGLGLAELHRRRPHGLVPLTAAAVGWVGLVLLATLSPTIRSLFFV